MASAELIQAVAATAELCGTTMSQPAAELLVADLSSFDERAVLVALSKCRREVKGRLTVAEILSRIDDGRPGVEEAWAMLPRDEDSTTVWTAEMAEAWGLVREMIAEGETVAARMAFKEAYQRLVNASREARQPAKWSVSLGHDVNGRKGALLMAVAQKRITAEYACALLPNFAGEQEMPLLADKTGGVIGPTHALAHFAEVDSEPRS